MNIPSGGEDFGKEMVLLPWRLKCLHSKVVSSSEGNKGADKIKQGGKNSLQGGCCEGRGRVYAHSFS